MTATTTKRAAPRAAVPPPLEDLPPLFGERIAEERHCEFRLKSYGSNGEQEHYFTARAEIDASTALAITRSGGLSARAAAMEKLFVRVLLDDDGVPQREKPTPVLDEDDEGLDEDTRAFRDEMHTGDWEIDGKTFPSRALAEKHGLENGSSLRRFAALLDDEYATVQFEALQQILVYVLEQSGQRPTAPSPPSQRRRTQRRR